MSDGFVAALFIILFFLSTFATVDRFFLHE